MSEDPIRYSAAPNRHNGEPLPPLPAWEPPAPVMSPMQVHAEFLPVSAAPEAVEVDPGVAQKQADEDAYRRLQDRSAARARTDYAGMQEDRRLNDKMLAIRRLRNEIGRDYLWEQELTPGPPLRVPPPVDRRTGSRG